MCATGGRACGGFVLLVWTEDVANGGMAVPKGRACARSDAANDTKTKFPTSGSVFDLLCCVRTVSCGCRLGLAMSPGQGLSPVLSIGNGRFRPVGFCRA